ncbi:AfsR/SARP family transcriptional regulator [Streptomyces sp. N2-109]|uniref:AfsR/SARP family transcriptional regulator n=1 Tax=Streptomyces gossypii TaxID=2883101 RepID=A0ABT2JP75_9ACTN|nr:AfsR/SARP family transcriptional regulator [Streptomyces gossypii]MCT2589678.1 AfsR/SARP family transcriptional regulator [Streptomyces gossypii]
MRFQLLGPLSMTDGNDAVVLQPSKPTILLATLLLHANSVVSVGYLLRTVWGEEQPATAKAALQTCVLRLRRLFSKHGVTDTPIEAVPGGYRITAGAQTLDLIQFRERVRAAGGLTAEPEAELSALKDALGLWQGSVLANVPSSVLHRDEVPRLTEERLRSVERVCDLELSMGRCGEALVELWSATRSYPGHERFWEQLIEALYRTGRQSEALGEYRRIKGHLLDELGVDPSPALQRLELQILRGEDLGAAENGAAHGTSHGRPVDSRTGGAGAAGGALAASGASAPPALEPARAATTVSVPEPPALVVAEEPDIVIPVPPVPSFTGRAAEVAALVARLTEGDGSGDGPGEGHGIAGGGGFATLVSGAPGIGKTALALHTAQLVRESFPDGRFLVRMVHPDGTPRSPAVVAEALREHGPTGTRALLVLDDVVDADQVRPLLTVVGDGATIVTSRRGLAGLVATHGGWVLRLGTFAPEESHQLLLSVLGTERVSAEPGAARRLAAACGHYPLALRILTARLLTRPGLRLADAVGWLTEDPLARLSLTDAPGMSVERVLGGALERLEPGLAQALLCVGTLPVDTFQAADTTDSLALPGAPSETPVAEAELLLDRLADAGLLEEGSPGPYRMHELLRVYARWVADRSRPRQKV